MVNEIIFGRNNYYLVNTKKYQNFTQTIDVKNFTFSFKIVINFNAQAAHKTLCEKIKISEMTAIATYLSTPKICWIFGKIISNARNLVHPRNVP